MNNVFKTLGFAIFAMFSVMCVEPAFASASCDGISISGMADALIVKLKQECVDIQAKAAATPITVENIEEYTTLGKKYGLALSEVAKSVGTTVNELAQTPVGIFMLIIVGWKTIGHDLLGVFGGVVWFTVMIPLWALFFRRLVIKDIKITDILDPQTGKIVKRVTDPINYDNGPGAVAGIMLIVLFSICVTGFFMIW